MNIHFDDLTQVYQRITFERFLFDKCKMKKNTGCSKQVKQLILNVTNSSEIS